MFFFFFSGRVGAGRSLLLMQAVIPRLSGLGKRGGGGGTVKMGGTCVGGLGKERKGEVGE